MYLGWKWTKLHWYCDIKIRLSAETASVKKITKKSAMVMGKAVTGKIPER